MQLLNQTLNGVSGLIAEFSVGLNLDIFETNIVNLTLLVGGIFYLGSNALSESLTERQTRVLGAIQEAEERLEQSVTKLAESEKNLTQAQLVITSLREEANATAKKVKSGILNDGKNEIERLTATAKSQISTIELKVRNQISEYVVNVALQRVTAQLEGKLGQSVQEQLIDKNISKL